MADEQPKQFDGAEADFTPGESFFLDSGSPSSSFAAVFEDDEETGYFYGLDKNQPQPILDALHIYNVKNVTDREIPSRAQIAWSTDGYKVVLFINGYAHAGFDFKARRGYCRTGFPPPAEEFSVEGHEWSDSILDDFQW